MIGEQDGAHALLHELVSLVVVGLRQWGIQPPSMDNDRAVTNDAAGAARKVDSVHHDAVRAKFPGRRRREADNSRLGGAVDGQAETSDAGVDGPDVEDVDGPAPAPLDHA
ncbi:hypothetical protein [Streptomyces sp. NPDC048606]|uniref:hypothetical protein n=1 Tax=Streptomyces sp. NPDC048606 TaxID=3154726 RepID=UPI003429E4A5